MNEVTKRKLNSTETIIQAIPRLIEAFVMYYGETEREKITNKFNKMIVVGYTTPEIMKRNVRDDLETKSSELVQEFLNNIKVSQDKRKEFEKIFFNNNRLEYMSLHPVREYMLYFEGNKNLKSDAVSFVSKFIPEITEDNIDEYIQNGKLESLNIFIQEYKKIIDKYNQYSEKFKVYYEYFDKCDKLKNELEKKYIGIMLDKLKYLFTNEELQEIEKTLNKPYGLLKNANKKAEIYFGYKMDSRALIDAFSKESEQLIKDGAEWRRNSVIDDRIMVFKNLGINLGSDYQSYVDNPEVNKLISKLQENSEKIIEYRNLLNDKMMKEYYQMLDDYKQHMERIQQAGLTNEYLTFGPEEYMLKRTYVSDKVRMTQNGYESVPVLCFSMGGISEYLDHALIHELNHVYELSLQKVDGNNTYSIVGWDQVHGVLKKEDNIDFDDDTLRKYELFNEVINELIAQEITEILFSADGYIFNVSDNAKVRGGTSYEHTRFLVKDFYETYKYEIVESRKNGNIGVLFDAIGRENFEELNNLFYEFHEHFSGFAFYNLMDCLEKKENNKLTRKFFEIKQKRDKILMAMAEKKKMSSGMML